MSSDIVKTTVLGYPVRSGGVSYLPRRAVAIQELAKWKSADLTLPDSWLRKEIGFAFQQMVCLGLPGAPAAEMLPMTAEMWVITIGVNMEEEIDRERIRAGFTQLYRTLKQWPQPVELLEVLPRRRSKSPTPPNLPLTGEASNLPPVKGGRGGLDVDCRSEEARQRGMEELQKIMEMLKRKESSNGEQGESGENPHSQERAEPE